MDNATPEARLLAFVGDIHGLLELSELWAGLLPALQRLLPADWVSLHEIDTEKGVVHGYAIPEPEPAWYAAFRRHGHQHPFVVHYGGFGDGRAHRISDFLTLEQFRALDMHREVFAPMGVDAQMAFIIRTVPNRVIGITLSRGPDFTHEERDLLNGARPFVIQAYRNALAHERLGQTAGQAQLRRERALAVLAEHGLTAREAQALLHASLGHSATATALELRISPRTVEKHFERAYRKLGVQGRVQAIARVWELARLPEPDAETLIPAKGEARA